MRREQVVQFGKSATLTGVLTIPDGGSVPGRPGFILLNSGILHRVGSCRLHVRLARALADAGFTALRFDFSGIGDSEPRKDSLAFEESAPLEVREAMDYLTAKRGASRFVVGGLCSGADMAHLTAKADSRVVGLVMLDAWAYRTTMFWVRYYAARAISLSAWKRWVTIRAARLFKGRARTAAAPGDGTVEYEVPKYVRRFPSRDSVAADLRDFVSRQIHIFTLFTSGQSDLYNHEGQYRRSFSDVPFGRLLEEHHLSTADHIITGLDDQAEVIRSVGAWTVAHFGGVGSEAAAPAESAADRRERLTVAQAR
jgi:pimeloyl-ACP methyl ester carboxylesterase